ncbi:MAG: hypothetical protein JF587_02025 [Catenulisporales bacterium]|nr:hypothetical protein [Catenulisporales bacterium]
MCRGRLVLAVVLGRGVVEPPVQGAGLFEGVLGEQRQVGAQQRGACFLQRTGDDTAVVLTQPLPAVGFNVRREQRGDLGGQRLFEPGLTEVERAQGEHHRRRATSSDESLAGALGPADALLQDSSLLGAQIALPPGTRQFLGDGVRRGDQAVFEGFKWCDALSGHPLVTGIRPCGAADSSHPQ